MKIKFYQTGDILSTGNVVEINIEDTAKNVFLCSNGPLTDAFMKVLVEKGFAVLVECEKCGTGYSERIAKKIEKIMQDKDYKEFLRITFNSLAKKSEWKVNKLCHILNTIHNINHGAVLSVFFKEMAILLDKKYPDHITKAKNHYIISQADHKIYSFTPKEDTNWDTIAVFRSITDAAFAIDTINVLYSDAPDDEMGFKINQEGLFEK